MVTCLHHLHYMCLLESGIWHSGVIVALGIPSLSWFFSEFCFPSSLPSSVPSGQVGLSLKENRHYFEVHEMFSSKAIHQKIGKWNPS